MEVTAPQVQVTLAYSAYAQTQIRNLTDGRRTVRPVRLEVPIYDSDATLEALWPDGWDFPEWTPEVLHTKADIAMKVGLAMQTSPVVFAGFATPHSYLGQLHRLAIISKCNAFVLEPTNPDHHEPLRALFQSSVITKVCYRGEDQQKRIERDIGVIPRSVIDIETIRLHHDELPDHASPAQIRTEFGSALELPLGFPDAVPNCNLESIKAVTVAIAKLWGDISRKLLDQDVLEIQFTIQQMLCSTHAQTAEPFQLVHFFQQNPITSLKEMRVRTALLSVARLLDLPTSVFARDYQRWMKKSEGEFLRELQQKVRTLPKPDEMDELQYQLIVPRLSSWYYENLSLRSQWLSTVPSYTRITPRRGPYATPIRHITTASPTLASRVQALELEQQPLDLSFSRSESRLFELLSGRQKE